ncbi:HAMP domain-containing protein [Nitrogeniibacter mangrovi]|uniref:histidine kinase n=1 Tax=Nitrogeniibacter mangrovi TaxID=2016596 RepID=A0A6C1B843_9RHOO|nr:ATP-binding protein [Nitrogeniibacter mangrovi]QID19647.1 HAMP domain-containing protein [Nitrogeniibacter mangrovi]
MKQIAIIVAAAVAGLSLFLLASATGNSELLSGSYPILLAINGFFVVALLGLVAYQLRSLFADLRAKKFGARLKYRLLVFFALMAIVPGTVVYIISLQFVMRSIETWFNVRVDAALEGGIALGQSTFDHLSEQLEDRAREMALELSDNPGLAVSRLNRLREQAGVNTATVFSDGGRVIATASSDVSMLMPTLPRPDQMHQVRVGQRARFLSADNDGKIDMMVIMPIPAAIIASDPLYLLLRQPVPETLSRHANAVQAAYRDYKQLSLGREGLKIIYTLTLTFSLLLALLAAVAVAFVIARRLTRPLLILAQGTEAVAQGDYSPRRALPAKDELGVLTQSFNQMTRQLDEARAQADRHQAAVEAARAYLESVLANLSTGVLAFAPDGTLRAANRGATQILDDTLDDHEHITLADWSHHTQFRDALLAAFARGDDDWHEQIEVSSPEGGQMTLLIHGSRLPEVSGGGTVVVFDDISHLIAAERTAAWGEVARRLAHEIKNPLTPIQLSAERLGLKLAPRLDEEGRALLERATGTIVNQVEAMKNLVNAFRDYAKLPSPTLTRVDLNELIHEVLALYEASPVPIRAELDPTLPDIVGDASQLRQVIHNLLQNAQDAMAEHADGVITIATTRRKTGRVRLSIADQGPGFPPDMLMRAFEPYYTTKHRGSGLGLAIVKKIIDEHGGDIRLINRETGGAEVRIHLRPVARDTD